MTTTVTNISFSTTHIEKAKEKGVFEVQDSTLQIGICYISFSEKH